MSRKELFSKRNETLKEEARLLQEEKDRVIKLFMQKFLWRYLITFYGTARIIKQRLLMGKMQAALKQRNISAALLIQRQIRKKYKELPEKPIRTLTAVRLCLIARGGFISPLYYLDAKNTLGTFFRSIRVPKKAILKMNEFISNIKKMQIRFKNHMFIKKASIEQMDSVWSREILN